MKYLRSIYKEAKLALSKCLPSELLLASIFILWFSSSYFYPLDIFSIECLNMLLINLNKNVLSNCYYDGNINLLCMSLLSKLYKWLARVVLSIFLFISFLPIGPSCPVPIFSSVNCVPDYHNEIDSRLSDFSPGAIFRCDCKPGFIPGIVNNIGKCIIF